MDFIFLGFFSTEIFWDCGGGISNKNYRTAPLYVTYISFHNILVSKRSLFLFSKNSLMFDKYSLTLISNIW